MRKTSEVTRKKNIITSSEWNKTLNRIVIGFKPSDQGYFDKWQQLPGDTNIDKIKGLLDRL